uniref:Uncharacterized protein n=1 Tax=Amazona collaria TaxID=241587 RepID=A0A8B9GCH4_9PSIT
MMSQSTDLENEIQYFLSQLARKTFFETKWDIAAFAIFLIVVGECIAQHEAYIPRSKVGIDNLAIEP